MPIQAAAAGRATFALTIPDDWRSGFYEVALTGDGVMGPEATSHGFLVVRAGEPGRETKSLLVLGTNTYNAYNKWGGECLYTGVPRVSFQRPMERGYVTKPIDLDGFDGRAANISPEPDPDHNRLQQYLSEHKVAMWTCSAGWHNWERRFVQWAEAAGFRFDYAISSDLEFRREILEPYRLLLSVGHDEYWSWGMRDTVDAHLGRGGNLAMFSGNAVYWQVRYEDDGRTMVCHKYVARENDPVVDDDDVPSEFQYTAGSESALVALNEKYTAVFANGLYRIMYREGEGETANGLPWVAASKTDFINRHENRSIENGNQGRGKPKVISLGAGWQTWAARKTADGTVLDPRFLPGAITDGKLNLWSGFAIKAEPGCCELFLKMIYEDLCSGDDAVFAYVLNWSAWKLQKSGIAAASRDSVPWPQRCGQDDVRRNDGTDIRLSRHGCRGHRSNCGALQRPS